MARWMRIHPAPVRVSGAILNPFVSCLGRPIVVWPESLAEPDVFAQNEGVFAHELAHVRRRDHWVAWLELAGVLVWWWNPVFWYICRKLEETRELACDALALELSSADPQDFATALLGMAASQHWVQAPLAPLSQGIGGCSSFQRRLKMLFDERASGRLSSVGLALAGLLAFVGLPGWAGAKTSLPRRVSSEAFRNPLPPRRPPELRITWRLMDVPRMTGHWPSPGPPWSSPCRRWAPETRSSSGRASTGVPVRSRDLPGEARWTGRRSSKSEVKWKAVINGAGRATRSTW